MKKLIITAGLVLFTAVGSLFAQSPTYVHGYTRSNGTHVNGYYRTSPNHTRTDNYSYHGNYNPFTGKYGTRY